ncbi:MAG: RnfABCDGE type electron transport complex subunit D [Anaerobiospirillum succiniciproducens]|uniref:RnfABCDGE type electron transport complex subunit D n=1 Tax=Anaerobiospirillum succiniciproducens TaxID=13335 RepID=UPI0026DBFEF6|nr:RnfABCDGE type electron transport complex subunit D [Anaerobiospirillum succiniciproducens]MDO4676571.1 RnfABCDGE type electron transport complex subunit D [Anaerobiospirillum succiniciproducens]
MQISVQSAKQNLGIEPAPHLHCQMSTTRIMMTVIVSLIPAVGVMTYFFGSGTLIQFIIASITAIACQVLTALMRNRRIKHVLRDPSGVVTALLLALTLPPLLPWYFTVMATAFAMLLVRECFGGLGMNIFNPAMSGFIFLVISAPGIFYSTWVSPTPGAMYVATPSRTLDVVFGGADPQVLIKEIKDLNRQNEYEVSHSMAQISQDRAQAEAQKQQETAASAAAAASDANADKIKSPVANGQDSTELNNENTSLADDATAAADTDSTEANVETNADTDATEAEVTTTADEAAATEDTAPANGVAASQETAAPVQEAATEDNAASDEAVNTQDEVANDAAMAASAAEDNETAQDESKLEATSAEVQIAKANDVAKDVATAKNENAAKVGQSVHMQDEIIANAHDTSNELMIREQERLQEQATIAIEGRFTADALTGATFLESIKTSRKAETVESVPHVDFTGPSFMAYAWLGGAYVLGGLILIFTGCIRFQVPLAFLGAVAATAAIWHHYDPALSITTVEHLLMGGTMLGAFYIITDPVTTCGTFKGRIILSAFIGVLAVIMRINGSYSDSIAFAVMLGNCLAPLMDVMTKRRPFGIGYRTGGLD